MKILMVHPSSELYGADRMFLLSIKACMTQFAESHIEVLLPHPGPLVSEIHKISQDIKVHFRRMGILRKSDLKILNFKALFYIACFFRLIGKLSSYNLVFINTIVIADYLMAARWSGTRVITHVHELPVGISRYIFKKLVALSRSELIFISQAVKDCFSQVPNPHQYVLWNGIPELKECTDAKIYAANRHTNILMVGRINAWKGQMLLVEAISILHASEKAAIRVTLLGDVYGNQHHFKEKLMVQIAKHNLQNIIRLQPFKAEPEMYYNEADVVVVPSLLPEPFGLVAIEAMRAGKPVIAARHGGLKEIVVDGSTGILFEPGDTRALADSISCLLQHPQKAKSMGLEGEKRYIQYFTEALYLHNLSKILSASE